MEKITKFSVNNPVTILMLILGISLLGYISFAKLGIDLFPNLNNPRIFVEIKTGERPPEEIEKQYVENIEALAIRQREAMQVSSVCRVGSAQITVEYGWETDMDEAFLDLQKALTSYSQNSDLDELTISRHDPNSAPVMIVGFSNPQITDMDELRRVAENYLRNELIRLDGVAEVELLGYEEKEAIIHTDDYRLQAYQLTPDDVVNKVTGYNRNMSGGSIEEMGYKYVIKGVGEFTTLQDIENVIVTYKNQESVTTDTEVAGRVPVFLRDVARVELVNKDPENIVHINGERCMALAIYKETRFNTVKASKALIDKLDELGKALPGYKLLIISDQGEFITKAIDEVKQSALIGVLLAVLVLFIFLRRIGITLIISLAIPISIIATFNLMYFKGLTLNIMTLGGLALGAGMLVDNAIIVMENIFRHLEEGASLRDAAVKGTAEVSGAITASTLTTIVVFLPIVFLHGAASELFKDQAWTVAFALLSSLIVAVLVIPMLSVKLLGKDITTQKQQTITFPAYPNLLNKFLDKSWLVITGTLILIIVSLLLIPVVGSEFIPKTNSNEYTINLELVQGTELQRTESTVKNIEDIINQVAGDDIITIYSKIGPAQSLTAIDQTYQDENTATILIKLRKNRKLGGQELINRLSAAIGTIPDVKAEIVQVQTELQTSLGTETAPILVEIKGEDLETIQNLTAQARLKMAAVPDLINITTNFDEGRPEVEVVIDRVRAGLLNITMDNISAQLQNQLVGKEAGQWQNEGETQDIILKPPQIGLKNLPDIVLQSGTERINLDDVTDIRIKQSTNEIYRSNQTRVGKISAHINSGKPFDLIVKDIHAQLKTIDYPAEYKYEITGEELKRKEAFGNLKFALLLSILLVYMVMASQFESLVHPFIILLTIPLAGAGTVLLFLVSGVSFNVMAYIGIIMLAGIAVNDSIILVDAINQIKSSGVGRRKAILQAGQWRIRPIIMTSLTTILALLPLSLGFGEGAELRAPLALAVIGGLISSTILTLIVIPCVYWKVDKLINPAHKD
ncbi:MAG TPA: efflux RND transporter permease subunit [bacterium]|nr:efflux RND transporter permease subunit [bacterium]HPN43685.1 efflux RND transporter permease subunit [bacterium]